MCTDHSASTQPSLRLVGHDRLGGFEPYDLQVVMARGRALDFASLLKRDTLDARQPELIDRSVLTTGVMVNRWRSPMTPRWYYLLMFQSVLEVRRAATSEIPTISWIAERLHHNPPEPAWPGDLQLATPTELLFVVGDWSMDQGIVYRSFMPILAIGGGRRSVRGSAGRKNTGRIGTFVSLELRPFDEGERTVLTAMDDHWVHGPETATILVRSRCYLAMRSVNRKR